MTQGSQAHIHIDTHGTGKNLVILHGWGMNAAVFTPLMGAFPEYRLHCPDLPGFGHSTVSGDTLDDWVDTLMLALPEQMVLAGWSLGGLVATRAALRYPQRVEALMTIASSPCFMAREEESWPGIPPQVLSQFGAELGKDLPKTIERFLAIQAMGSETAREDIKRLRDLVLSRPLPQQVALDQGLNMLKDVDLRPELATLSQPWLRVWGRLDGLVPKRVMPAMPSPAGACEDLMLAKASHAPFFSHPSEFVTGVKDWLSRL
ncbi:pimeloyl-ACP methyl ester esterase BioH [Shewanella zhangzhouensis]|uniref:pimeloyl-ACP methyl ester esterase BioH n=1 Tax=Shewanella zhangzhouensis TaxID=2864213 RepID=UPI001C65F026|nr:pimeloyl-ACP methyl ester esterase BioH [Shewanella zhangzhouensis]QYK05128.1 pimeloyl-ACP methyl ester esterase BioH [Shewanella zhangzhouensis]